MKLFGATTKSYLLDQGAVIFGMRRRRRLLNPDIMRARKSYILSKRDQSKVQSNNDGEGLML